MTDNLQNLLKIAVEAARQAGQALLSNRQDWQSVDSQSERDVKAAGDKKSEELILTYLNAKSEIRILSEEEGWSGEDAGEYYWVVDPLDGTVNYTQGIPLCCVSIALMKGRTPVLGVVYDFNHDEMFSGIVGQGAYLNGEAISVSNKIRPEQAVLNTGFPANSDFSDEAMTAKAIKLSKWRKVRMLGTAALSLSFVSCGRSDAYWESNIMLWDVAAGCALVKAAGGDVRIIGEDLNAPIQIMAGNSDLMKWV